LSSTSEGYDAAGLVEGDDAVAGVEPGGGLDVGVGVVRPSSRVIPGGAGEGADEVGDRVEGHGVAGLAAEGEVVAEMVVRGHSASLRPA